MSRILILCIFALFIRTTFSLRQWPIQSMADLNKAAEQQAMAWFKKYTAPNTRDANGKPWTPDALPRDLRKTQEYKNNPKIKPAAWVTAVSAAWALREGIFNEPDWYRVPISELTNTPRCDPFPIPPQIPPKTSKSPTWLFSYNLCKGKGVPINPASGTFGSTRSCIGTYGKMIGPNEACQPQCSSCWQNGIFGMEQTHGGTASHVADVAEKIYRSFRGSKYTYIDVLDNTLTVAGFSKSTSIYKAVMTCCVDAKTKKKRKASELSMACADLIKMWLVRNHLIGVTLVLWDNPEMFGTSKFENVNVYNPTGILVLARYFNT